MRVSDRVLQLFKDRGDLHYGEKVTVREHSEQVALHAVRAGASNDLVVAGLLHDIGHLVHDLPESIADAGIDAAHEEIGAEYLKADFPPEITEPIRLHVAAKRYLCAVDPTYRASLSEASELSLGLQGGPMSAVEIEEFERHPHFQAATELRRWDDLGKVEGVDIPAAETYGPQIEIAVRGGG